MNTPVYFGLTPEEPSSDSRTVEAFYQEYGAPTLYDRLVDFVAALRSSAKAVSQEKPTKAPARTAVRTTRGVRPARPAPVRPMGVAHA